MLPAERTDEQLALYRRYLEGNHDLQYATQKFRQAFGRLFDTFAYNRCATVVDAHADGSFDTLLRESTTLGVRSYAVERTALERDWVEVETPWGRVRVKRGLRFIRGGEKELVELADPVAGDYVLRVVNYTSVTPSYTLEAAVVREVVTDRTVIAGKVERWTLTCEKDGKVLEQVPVVVDRGQQVKADLRTCIARWRTA